MRRKLIKSKISQSDKAVEFSLDEKNLKFHSSIEITQYGKPEMNYDVSVKNHWLFGKDWRTLFSATEGTPAEWIKDVDRKLTDLTKLKNLLVELNDDYKKFKKTYKPKKSEFEYCYNRTPVDYSKSHNRASQEYFGAYDGYGSDY